MRRRRRRRNLSDSWKVVDASMLFLYSQEWNKKIKLLLVVALLSKWAYFLFYFSLNFLFLLESSQIKMGEERSLWVKSDGDKSNRQTMWVLAGCDCWQWAQPATTNNINGNHCSVCVSSLSLSRSLSLTTVKVNGNVVLLRNLSSFSNERSLLWIREEKSKLFWVVSDIMRSLADNRISVANRIATRRRRRRRSLSYLL